MASVRPLGGGQEADLGVVMQRAHGEARAPRQLADLPHGSHRTASRYVRFKPDRYGHVSRPPLAARGPADTSGGAGMEMARMLGPPHLLLLSAVIAGPSVRS